ncbi:thioredoxin domain-containing protein [Candidatus Woesearchaeota archaeon]|nr:thioredoxin domain-containing protein [Candidatus Woesearchaeota archaeon]
MKHPELSSARYKGRKIHGAIKSILSHEHPVRQAISWREWGAAVFKEAKTEKKPVLLSISATWCHWCHTMDREAYSDENVAHYINEFFIPVRVDTDQRPDINARYNMGGWPSTVFLNSKGEVIMGGTYLPADQMLATLRFVHESYKTAKPHMHALLTAPSPKLPTAVEDSIWHELRNEYDPAYGGFGAAPKFPHTGALHYLALRARHGDEECKTMLAHTLASMANAPIHDKEQGGFYRYATQNDWSWPHYEKILNDNANLLMAYVNAYRLTGKAEFARIAKGIIAFMEDVLADNGVFFASQDADEEYCRLPIAARRKRGPPAVDRTVYTGWNALAARAYMLYGKVLNDPRIAEKGLHIIGKLLDTVVTSGRVFHTPAKDSSFLADQVNLLLAVIDAYCMTGFEAYLQQASILADTLLKLYMDEQGFADIPKGRRIGLLATPVYDIEDNAVAIIALLKLAALGKPFAQAAKKAMTALSGKAAAAGLFGAAFGIAAHMVEHGVTCITSPPNLYDIARKFYAEEFILIRGSKGVAQVCVGKSCVSVPRTSEELSDAMAKVFYSQ